MTNTQKTIKYCAVGFAFFIIISIITSILYGISFFINIFIDNTDVSKNLKEVDKISNQISEINISIKTAELNIKTGDEFKVETNNDNIIVEQNAEILFVREKKHTWNRSNVTLYIPEDLTFDIVKIEAGAGRIDIYSLTAKKIYFDFGAGDVLIDNLYISEKAEIENGAGQFKLLNGEINNLDLDIGVGKIKLDAKLIGKNEINSGVGAVNLNLIGNDYIFNCEKGLGLFTINNENIKSNTSYGSGSNIIDIEGGIGSIEINTNN